jgi:hypothetical protein
MLPSRIILPLSLCCLSCAFAQASSLEKRIVGTWQFSMMDATGRMIFRADHTYSTLFPFSRGDDGLRDWTVVFKGTWRIDGHYLVVEEKDVFKPSAAGNPPPPIRHVRVPIRLITKDKVDLDRLIMKRIQ